MKKIEIDILEKKLEKKIKQRERKRKPKMKVSGKSVFRLQKLIAKKDVKISRD
ncbi:MAG: hypothetical protein ABIH38_02405 [Patescibacteria group bacterium]